MRLDLFLKASRLCPRRTVAQQLCDAGLVKIGDKVAKSSHVVKPGDEIAIERRDRVTRVRVKQIPDSRQVSRKDASSLFELLHEELRERD